MVCENCPYRGQCSIDDDYCLWEFIETQRLEFATEWQEMLEERDES